MGEALQKMEERLDRIEEELRQIKALLKPKQDDQPWWQEFVGVFANNPLFDEVVKDIEKERRKDKKAVCAALDGAEI